MMKKNNIALSTLFGLLGLISACGGPLNKDGYYYKAYNNNMMVEWRVTQNERLDIRVSAPTDGWVGIGLFPNPESNIPAQMVVGYNKNGESIYQQKTSRKSNAEQFPIYHVKVDEFKDKSKKDILTTRLSFTIQLPKDTQNNWTGLPYEMLLIYGPNGYDTFDVTHVPESRLTVPIEIKQDKKQITPATTPTTPQKQKESLKSTTGY